MMFVFPMISFPVAYAADPPPTAAERLLESTWAALRKPGERVCLIGYVNRGFRREAQALLRHVRPLGIPDVNLIAAPELGAPALLGYVPKRAMVCGASAGIFADEPWVLVREVRLTPTQPPQPQ